MVQDVGSILAVDFGSVTTRAVLIDVVDGAYRLIARAEERTTDGFPAFDLDIGLDRVLRQLTEITGRRFRDETGVIISPERPDRSGVDLFAITASLGKPLQAVIV
ncbi:MAG: glutamate mutase L, partial [Anaerolineae bacterium]|nr:glutamate mutase L [Anaerolineae bacterium]